MTKSTAEVARLFRAETDIRANLPEEVYPGYPGAVIAEGRLRSMVWGFPLSQKSKRTGEPLKPRPVNNARSDKLDSFMWRHSFAQRRCLIPLSAWAEAEGPKGSKTRTWLSVAEEEIFCAAGIWRESDEWGACYSMVMTDAAGDAATVHNRMPVILAPEVQTVWTGSNLDAARSLCLPYKGEIAIARTDQPWSTR